MKPTLSATYDVNLYGNLQSFCRWNITPSALGIQVTQTSYAKRILAKYGLEKRNPLPNNADLSPRNGNETKLSHYQHSLYRYIIGSILYLATFNIPDLTFQFSFYLVNYMIPANAICHFQNDYRIIFQVPYLMGFPLPNKGTKVFSAHVLHLI